MRLLFRDLLLKLLKCVLVIRVGSLNWGFVNKMCDELLLLLNNNSNHFPVMLSLENVTCLRVRFTVFE